ELQLGHDAAVEACTTLLSYLDSRWYALPAKRATGEARGTVELCVGGLGAAYFRVAGRTFNSADLLGRTSYQGTQHLATLGALAVRALTTMLVEEPPAPALMLAETPDEKACVIVPSRTFSAGRVLRSLASGPERKLRLTRLIQRGADFERTAFEEVPV